MAIRQGLLLWALLSAVTVSVRGLQPEIVTPSGGTWTSEVGGIVSLTCRVQNLGSRKLNWVFATHDTTIFHGDQLMVTDSRYTLVHPPDSDVYSLQIMFAKEEDQGVYKCEIEGTTKVISLHLVLQGAPASPDLSTPREPLNRTSCCVERGVSTRCQPICNPSTAPGLTNLLFFCNSDLINLIYCGSDGRNHEDCCARSNVSAECLPFCSNDVEKMSTFNIALAHCLTYAAPVISCYEYGAEMLPTPPQSFSVISLSRNGSHVLQITWKPPRYNPSTVSGYRVYYKNSTESHFRATGVLNAETDRYSLPVQVNTMYTVYAVAVSNHGSSQPTNRVDILVEDTSTPGHDTDVLLCCEIRNVPAKCRRRLCQPRVWAQFNVTEMLECYLYLPDIYTCLAGERDHSVCCTNNNVPENCVGMCSGHPPPFNRSMATCVPKLSVVEACIQSGLSYQPKAPHGLTLSEVYAHSAVVTWTRPNNTAVNGYMVQLRRGNDNAPWLTVDRVVGTFVELMNLTETENYAVRVISQTANSSSLPSAVFRFTTYPETSAEERPTVAHNITQCCVDTQMPEVCSNGCHYLANMTTYFADPNILPTCMDYIGTVLTCAADGRDHTPCCRQRNVQALCHDLCSHASPGALDARYLACIADTASIVQCYREGLADLVRMPEEVLVSNVTSHTITLVWKNPETGPTPQRYRVQFTNHITNTTSQGTTTGLIYILQHLVPGTAYNITVTSVLNDTTSPPTPTITAFTPALDSELPYIPHPPSNTSRALWTNRTHCCQSGSITPACRSVCMNRPATDATDCSTENHKILACAADGQDHSLCCQENGLAAECLPLCSSHTPSNFSVRLAGCLADHSLSIITSCFLSNTGLLPSTPYNFRVEKGQGSLVTLHWTAAINCNGSLGLCSYDVHYWPTSDSDPSAYTTRWNVTSPLTMTDLTPNQRYTFTVTARNSKGSGSPAPWVTLFFGDLVPDISIAQYPKLQVFNQGTTVSLTCDVYNLQGAPSFTWRLRSRMLATRGRVLRLPKVTRRSEGNYSCTVMAGDVTVSAASYVNVRFQPEFSYFRTDTVRPNMGQEAVLACWFRGHPSTNDRAGVWTKDGEAIPQTSRHSATAKSRYHTGITAFKLKIARLKPSDYGMYQCNVSNQYGYAVAHTKLIDPAKVPPPVDPPPLQKKNVSECCRARGVADVCMPLCSMEVSAAEAIANPDKYGQCLFYFSDLIECAADGADHTLCCEDKVVQDLCLPFCKGEVPPLASLYNAPNLLQCVPETPIILDCMDRGYGKIPTAPRSVAVSFIASKIKVSWEQPTRNADRVTSYNIYYNFTGNPAYQTETVTPMVGNSHTLQNVETGHRYQVWMTADSYKFGRSQISNVVFTSSHGELPLPPTGLWVTDVTGTTAVIGWGSPPHGSVPAEAFSVYYQPLNAIKVQKEVTSNRRITLKNLKPDTEYEVHVASRNIAGEGLRSAAFTFTTAPEDQTRPVTGGQSGGLGGGQIAGIVLAVIVVIAVTILLAVLLYRSRDGKKLTESVSFENPSYGNQQVHIDGLPTNNPYDNVMQPQTEPEKDGDFSYARLKEERAAVESAAKPAAAGDLPSTEYATPADPNGVSVDVAGAHSNAALEISGTDAKNESTM